MLLEGLFACIAPRGRYTMDSNHLAAVISKGAREEGTMCTGGNMWDNNH